MAQLLDVDIFILGHQAQATGYLAQPNDLLILASDHNHGVAIKFDLDKEYSLAQLESKIVPLASIC